MTGATTLRSMKRDAVIVAALLVAGATNRTAQASDLYGSRSSMEHQHSIAVDLDYSFAQTASQVERDVASGQLVAVSPNADLRLMGVSFPYAQPEVRKFIERLAAEYHIATGLELVVTSLTRPISQQPDNASPLSVHPAGMAVDLRIPPNKPAIVWLTQRLLELEEEGVLDVTLERRPPHMHVAVFPEGFTAYVARMDSLAAQRNAQRVIQVVATSVTAQGNDTHRASGGWLFAALAGGMVVSLVVAASRRSAQAFARLGIKDRR